MKRSVVRTTLFGIVAVVAIVALVAPTPASAKSICKIAKVAGDENTLENWVLQRFEQLVERRTNGEIDVQPMFGSALGSGVQVTEGVRLGSLQGTYNVIGEFSTWVPQADVFNLPFLFRDDDHALAVTNGPVGRKVAAYFAPHGFHVSAFWNVGFRNPVGHYPIEKVEDAVGKKVRIKHDKVAMAIWKAVGANPTPIAWPEVRNAMETRTVDLFDTLGSSYWDMKLYEFSPYYSELGITYVAYALAFSENWWKKQSPEHQKIMNAAAQELAVMQHHMIEFWNIKGPVLASRLGAKVNYVKDKTPWADKMKNIWGEWAAKAQGGQELIDAIRAVK